MATEDEYTARRAPKPAAPDDGLNDAGHWNVPGTATDASPPEQVERMNALESAFDLTVKLYEIDVAVGDWSRRHMGAGRSGPEIREMIARIFGEAERQRATR